MKSSITQKAYIVDNCVRKKSSKTLVANQKAGFPVFQFHWRLDYDCSNPITYCFVINCMTKRARSAAALSLWTNQLESQVQAILYTQLQAAPVNISKQ